MINLEELLELLKEGKNDDIIEGVKKLLEANIALGEQITALETERNTLKGSGDELSTIREILGIKEGELSKDVIEAKFKKMDKGDEIKVLEDKIKEINESYKNQLTAKDALIFEKTLDSELLKKGSDINAVSSVAHNVIMQELKNGLTIENGVLSYKDATGLIVRDATGLPKTVDSKLAEIKGNPEYSAFFKANVNSGSGTQTAATASGQPNQAEPKNEGMRLLMERKKAMGLI